jgi:hypothetical protein
VKRKKLKEGINIMNEAIMKMQDQMRRIQARIPQVAQALQAIVWGFQNGEKDIFLKQVIDFAYNFVSGAEVNDERTELERIEQAEEVVRAINTAASILPIEVFIKEIFNTMPGGEIQKKDSQKVEELIALVRRGVDAIRQ